jgi:hypothetical protein
MSQDFVTTFLGLERTPPARISSGRRCVGQCYLSRSRARLAISAMNDVTVAQAKANSTPLMRTGCIQSNYLPGFGGPIAPAS